MFFPVKRSVACASSPGCASRHFRTTISCNRNWSNRCAEPTSARVRCSATSRWRSGSLPITRCASIRQITDRALAPLSPQLGALYVHFGRPSVPPEQVLRALLLQALYSIRNERQLMEQLDYNLLFRWFVGLGIDDPVWSPTTFTKNRDRLLRGDIAQTFFEAVRLHADSTRLLSDPRLTVDDAMLSAWSTRA